MKEIRTKMIRSAWLAWMMAMCVVTVVPLAYGGNISKTFEFGPGTPNASSNVRTYPIPCGLEVAAVVKFRRLGSDKLNLPISIELREPDTATGVEGPIVETRLANVTVAEKTETLRSVANNRGCSKPGVCGSDTPVRAQCPRRCLARPGSISTAEPGALALKRPASSARNKAKK